MLETPLNIRTLQRKLYCKAKQESDACKRRLLENPDTGKLYARFDEEELKKCSMC